MLFRSELSKGEAGWQLGCLRNDEMQPDVTLSRLGHCQDCSVAIFAQDTGVSDVISNILGELTLNKVIGIIERFARRTQNERKLIAILARAPL